LGGEWKKAKKSAKGAACAHEQNEVSPLPIVESKLALIHVSVSLPSIVSRVLGIQKL
jgi:hypothetical protein